MRGISLGSFLCVNETRDCCGAKNGLFLSMLFCVYKYNHIHLANKMLLQRQTHKQQSGMKIMKVSKQKKDEHLSKGRISSFNYCSFWDLTELKTLIGVTVWTAIPLLQGWYTNTSEYSPATSGDWGLWFTCSTVLTPFRDCWIFCLDLAMSCRMALTSVSCKCVWVNQRWKREQWHRQEAACPIDKSRMTQTQHSEWHC